MSIHEAKLPDGRTIPIPELRHKVWVVRAREPVVVAKQMIVTAFYLLQTKSPDAIVMVFMDDKAFVHRTIFSCDTQAERSEALEEHRVACIQARSRGLSEGDEGWPHLHLPGDIMIPWLINAGSTLRVECSVDVVVVFDGLETA